MKNFIKKVSYGSHSIKKLSSEHDDMVSRYDGAGRIQTIKSILSQSRIENLVDIILGRFQINKIQK
jgi:hypothetical protein